jgi:hypothetical protein
MGPRRLRVGTRFSRCSMPPAIRRTRGMASATAWPGALIGRVGGVQDLLRSSHASGEPWLSQQRRSCSALASVSGWGRAFGQRPFRRSRCRPRNPGRLPSRRCLRKRHRLLRRRSRRSRRRRLPLLRRQDTRAMSIAPPESARFSSVPARLSPEVTATVRWPRSPSISTTTPTAHSPRSVSTSLSALFRTRDEWTKPARARLGF